MSPKRVITICLLFLVRLPVPLLAADQWMVRRETSSGVCHLQKKTASLLGVNLAGPFDSRKGACLKAKDLYDPDGTDSSKCTTYGQGTIGGCKNEVILLPVTTDTHSTTR
jgi:hypothetical protein